ncbi:unnamed protein product [Ranitomeya imitator]|uniref:Uncharacterized protein n=1 Tax=Ranitomeya imitator TaxID=111125 RepID=A0ABN9L951_9NEOB|nr:unnamed protein product [Ranitomeya imitator]
MNVHKNSSLEVCDRWIRVLEAFSSQSAFPVHPPSSSAVQHCSYSEVQGRAKYACAGAAAEDQKRRSWNEDGRRRSGPETPIRPDQQRDRPWDVEKERDPLSYLSKEETKEKIQLYNAAVTDKLKMTLNSSSGIYTGFIKVQMELRRPITVRTQTHANGNGNDTAFYLPKGSINILHISSTNTVREVIEALLKKFLVADNPAKFALYKRCQKEDQVYMCRLSDREHPLYLRLVAGPNLETLSFVLREHETGDVMQHMGILCYGASYGAINLYGAAYGAYFCMEHLMELIMNLKSFPACFLTGWEAFTIPELQNFLRILDKEEDEQLQSLKRRYSCYKEKLEEALSGVRKPG